jgi:hypothetical protein
MTQLLLSAMHGRNETCITQLPHIHIEVLGAKWIEKAVISSVAETA